MPQASFITLPCMWFKLLVSVHYLLERCGLIVVHALLIWNLLVISQMFVIMTIFCYVFRQACPSHIATEAPCVLENAHTK